MLAAIKHIVAEIFFQKTAHYVIVHATQFQLLQQ